MSSKIIQEKIKQAVDILKEKDIDMWMTFVRESSVIRDPSMEMIVGPNVTWQSAFIINKDGDTTAIVGDMEKEIIDKLGYYKNTKGYLKSIKEPLIDYLNKKNPANIALNYSSDSVLSDGLTHGAYQILLNHLKDTDFKDKIVSSEEIVSALRGRKSKTEIELLTSAVKETEKIFKEVTNYIRPGRSEIEIADFIKNICQSKGYELAWDADHCPAVFTGPDIKGAHSGPTEVRVEEGHMVNIDFGLKYEGYCSDMQRTWYVLKQGEDAAPEPVVKGFNIIRDAIQKVADALKPGVTGKEMDDIARTYIIEQGYDEYPHGLGHQVGRSVHDGGAGLFPDWEKYGNTPFMKIEEGQVFTIEPRLTVKGYGVSTLEEEVVVTKDGCKFISTPQKELWLIK